MTLRALLLLLIVLAAPAALTVACGRTSDSSSGDRGAEPAIDETVVEQTATSMIETFGEDQQERIHRGVQQVAERWWPEDGDSAAFTTFCEENFVADPARMAVAFARLQQVLEQIDGRMHEIARELSAPKVLNTGPVQPVDELLSDVDLSAHVGEDLFKTRVAFYALLNFPVHTLEQRLEQGADWDRQTWAQSRMMDRFADRVPADVAQRVSTAFNAASGYIDTYNIRMDRLVTPAGERLFPEGLRLISHWGLRDELGSQYGDPAGLQRQRMIYTVMQRIVRQEIPAAAIDNADVVWCPETNEVLPANEGDAVPAAKREDDARYARLLDVFRAVRAVDPYTPTAPTYIVRRFDGGRQIPKEEVEALLISVLESDEVTELSQRIAARLGRPLEPFDIWYAGFKSRGSYPEAELDRIVGERYPDTAAFQAALPSILTGLGFGQDKAAWLAEHIVVDPSRGAGHALGAVRREDRAHLRTRIGDGGMDYKGYNIAIHELGHNVEQVFSLNGIDHWWLNGVPNTAFTEALAFVFQARDLELLGLSTPAAEARHTEALGTLWGTYEIGGVALVDIRVWDWMYAHPDATPAQLREATLEIARDVWNTFYAERFGVRDSEILAIYSHMIAYGLYLPDYPIGHIIAFQVADQLRKTDFGDEFERLARQGQLTPDAWMRGAVGTPISTDALLEEARQALDAG